ncbi:unnamed protein product [Protopolystoma xenopodis]|uniref:Uncharacterized protein n=1 Tax=Protopolystoma xenopodis TaxID=117903 RepID=A0A3S5A6H5_9PLAT|nr:unnamed protein product [Protopolystoma xenopodis]
MGTRGSVAEWLACQATVLHCRGSTPAEANLPMPGDVSTPPACGSSRERLQGVELCGVSRTLPAGLGQFSQWARLELTSSTLRSSI